MFEADPVLSAARTGTFSTRGIGRPAGRPWAVLACAALICAAAWAGDEGAKPDGEPLSKPGGVQVNTTLEIDVLMNEAERLLDEQRYYEGMRVLQRVSDAFGDQLTFQADGVYRPGRIAAQRRIAAWATDQPEALNTYRVMADATVKAMLGAEPASVRDERKLRAVVDRYMLSSHGDEAALALGSLLIDRQAYAEAAAVLLTLVGEDRIYPDPSVNLTAVWSRLGLAAARLGDRHRAQDAIAALEQANAPKALVEAIARHMPGATAAGTGASAMAHQPMPAIEPMPQPDAQGVARWGLLWTADSGPIYAQVAAAMIPGQACIPRWQLLERWRAKPFRPATMARVVDGDLLFRAGVELVRVDLSTGERRWTTRLAPQDGGTASIEADSRFADGDAPQNVAEILFFGDRKSQHFTTDQRRAYVVRPDLSDDRAKGSRNRQGMIQLGAGYVSLPPNKLIAIDLDTGKSLWHSNVPPLYELVQFHMGAPQPRRRDAPPHPVTARLPVIQLFTHYLGAPRVVGDRLLGLIDEQGRIFLVVQSAEDGRLLWRRELAELQSGDAAPWAPTGLAVDQSTIYVSTGRGLIIAADLYTGQLKWMLPYARNARDVLGVHDGMQARRLYPTWHENRLLVMGRMLVVTAADARGLMMVDRRTGRRIATFADDVDAFSTDQMEYLIGTMGERIYIGGSNQINCFDVKRGEHLWTATWDKALGEKAATGRALLTPTRIFVPVDRHIVSIDPASGQALGRPAVVSDHLDQPLGNLYSDGRQLLSVGIDRVHALGDLRSHMARLAPRIEAGDVNALLQRASVWQQLDEPDKALADLRRAERGLPDGPRREALRTELRARLLVRVLEGPESAQAATLLDEAEALADQPGPRAAVDLARAERLIAIDRTDEAVKLLHRLAMRGADIQAPADPRRPGWYASAAVLAGRRLSDLAGEDPRQDAAVVDTLEALGRVAMGDLGASPAAADLARMVRAHPRTPTADRALDRLATMAAGNRETDFATAEMALRQLTGHPSPPVAAAAVDALAGAYLERGWPYEAQQLLQQHQHRMEAAGVATADAAESDADANADTLSPLQRRIAGALADHDQPDGERLDTPPLTGQLVLPAAEGAGPYVLDLLHAGPLDHSPWLREQLFVYDPLTRRVIRHVPRRGFETAAQITLPQELAVSDHSRRPPIIAGGVDGHVLVAMTPTRTIGYDLLTGQALWETPATTGRRLAAKVDSRSGNSLVAPCDFDRGMMIELVVDPTTGDPQALARDLLTGKVVWRYQAQDQSLHGGLLGDRYAVITAGAQGERLLIHDRWTGRPRPQRSNSNFLGKAILGGGQLHLTPYGVVYAVLRQVGEQEVKTRFGSTTRRIYKADVGLVPVDEQTEPWVFSTSTRGRRTSLDPLGPRHVMIDMEDRFAAVVDVRTGRKLWTTREKNIGPNARHVYFDPRNGHLTLYQSHRLKNKKIVRTLHEVEVTTGRRIRKINIDGISWLDLDRNIRMVARSGPTIPMLGRTDHRKPLALWLFDRTDGLTVDSSTHHIPIAANAVQSSLIRGGAMILPTQGGIFAYLNPDPADARSRRDHHRP